MAEGFGPCEICGSDDWTTIYDGPVRHGAFGSVRAAPNIVARCNGCGVERLEEAAVDDEDIYAGVGYRELLGEATDAAGFFAKHDILQLQHLDVLWPESLRNLTVADIGCAAGSFLDHVKGLAARTLAIEPCVDYHDSLQERGNEVFASTADAVRAHPEHVDFAFSFSVIEHVADPRALLSDIGSLLTPGGRALISTPNRLDILMQLLPDDYPEFFYRTVHRWYFDADSLSACAKKAGLEVMRVDCVHRFGLSNAMRWLRDRAPGGRGALPELDSALLDGVWRSHLTERGVGDYLYAWLVKPGRQAA